PIYGSDKLLVPRDGEAVGHPGDEIADRTQLFDFASAMIPVRWKQGAVGAVGDCQIGDDALGLLADRNKLRQPVEPLIKESLELPLLARERVRKAGQRATRRPDVLDGLHAGFTDSATGLGEHVADHRAD